MTDTRPADKTPADITPDTSAPDTATPNTSANGQGAADAARLRDEIDRGGTGDKVAFTDPSAAPLGTDDEAAGAAPSSAQVRTAAQHETRRDKPEPGKPTPQELQGPEHGKLMKSLPKPVIWMIVGIVVVIVLGGLLSGMPGDG